MSINVRPLHDRVIIERIEERTTAAGIVIPETAGEKPQRGKVLAVGNDKDIQVKVGDEVLFGKYAGTEVKVDGKNLLVMKEEDVIGIIEA